MQRSSVMFLLVAALASAGGVAAVARDRDDSDAQQLAKALAGYTPGRPTSCLPPDPTMSTQVIGKTILYQRGRFVVYRNDTAGGCEGAAHGDILVSVEHEGRPCSGDIIRTVDPTSHFASGSCALGQFVPYKRTMQ